MKERVVMLLIYLRGLSMKAILSCFINLYYYILLWAIQPVALAANFAHSGARKRATPERIQFFSSVSSLSIAISNMVTKLAPPLAVVK